MSDFSAGFWGNNHYQHARLTDDMVRGALRTLGVLLPYELVELLRVQNGGYTQGFAHPTPCPTSWAPDRVPLPYLAGIVTDPSNESPQNLLASSYLAAEWGLPARQVLLSGAGPCWLSLDYRTPGEPSVVWLDADTAHDIQVAPSFGQFLKGLVSAAAYDEA